MLHFVGIRPIKGYSINLSDYLCNYYVVVHQRTCWVAWFLMNLKTKQNKKSVLHSFHIKHDEMKQKKRKYSYIYKSEHWEDLWYSNSKSISSTSFLFLLSFVSFVVKVNTLRYLIASLIPFLHLRRENNEKGSLIQLKLDLTFIT